MLVDENRKYITFIFTLFIYIYKFELAVIRKNKNQNRFVYDMKIYFCMESTVKSPVTKLSTLTFSTRHDYYYS